MSGISKTPPRVLFVGNAFEGSTAFQRRKAFAELGHEVFFVPSGDGFPTRRSFYRRVRHKLGMPLENCGENLGLVKMSKQVRPELIWIEKGTTIRRSCIQHIKGMLPDCKVVSFSSDDMMNPRNQSYYWRSALSSYDVHVTTKTYNITELTNAGAQDVVFMPKSFDPDTHKPLSLTQREYDQYGARVAFVGSHEKERANSIMELSFRGIPVRVWGNGWQGCIRNNVGLIIEGRPVYGNDYAKVLNASKINLCFLRKMNRDQQTARSIEIPACGAFMLAERTGEHLQLFREGIEAEFFADDEELLEKVRYYLAHDAERRKIAAAGRQRCLDDKYSHASRLRKVLNEIFQDNPARMK